MNEVASKFEEKLKNRILRIILFLSETCLYSHEESSPEITIPVEFCF